MGSKQKISDSILSTVLALLSCVMIAPILIIFINSLKGRFFISDDPFALPNAETFVQLTNYASGLNKIQFFDSFKWSLVITVISVIILVIFTSMTAWYITRVKNKFTSGLYYAFVFSMIVPFQMVMFPMSYVASRLHLDGPLGIAVIYLGFGAGLCVFTFSGFIKTIPLEIEEAAFIDGCNPIRAFFNVIFQILRPTSITVAILMTMWIWNDYLLPSLLLNSENRTIPMAVQYLCGGYGSMDMGAMMAMLILSMVPIIILYVFCQNYIVKGATSGAVKG